MIERKKKKKRGTSPSAQKSHTGGLHGYSLQIRMYGKLFIAGGGNYVELLYRHRLQEG